MASCEKCWDDSYLMTFGTGKDRAEVYNELLKERENNPCTEKEQAGQFWDDEKGIDKRKIRDEK